MINQEQDNQELDNKKKLLNDFFYLVRKLIPHFSDEEIHRLLATPQENFYKELMKVIEHTNILSEIKPNIPDQENNQVEAINKLIKNHLLAVNYHVFQWLEFYSFRNNLNEIFNTKNISDGSITRFGGNRNYNKIKEYIFNKLNIDWERRTAVKDYVSTEQHFRHSSGQEAKLGRIFITTAQIDNDEKGFVIIEGSFSTETIFNRFQGRTNKDNQIIWVFDTQEAALAFVDMFNTAIYDNDPTDVENNTKIIEQSFKAMNLNLNLYTRLEARLLLGLQVIKLN